MPKPPDSRTRGQDEVGALLKAIRGTSRRGTLPPFPSLGGARAPLTPPSPLRRADNIKFRALVGFSMNAFCSAISQENNLWREYILIAIEYDAAKLIIEVLQKHKGHEVRRAAATTARPDASLTRPPSHHR